jgi:uncharacterized repeat protein (TIGR01451 family)
MFSPSSDLPQFPVRSTAPRWLRPIGVVALAALTLMTVSVALFGVPFFQVDAAGTLTIEIIAAYNLVVDSNVLAPSTYAPSVATVGGKVCNTSSTDTVTGVQLYIGNYNGGTGSTPGIYPARNSATDPAFADPLQYAYLAGTGLYSFTHVGGRMGLADATRYVGALLPGQCQVQYWHFTYPRRSNGAGPTYTPNAGDQPTWGQTRLTSDDLALGFDIWSTAGGGVSPAYQHQTMTVRNEISAMANKIQPNPNGHWFNTNTDVIMPGNIITSNGILYELGVINQGFDNDGDFTPDFNAWVQPIGDPAYDPSCYRLIRTSGVITVSRGGGNPDTIIPFTDKLYFTNLPSDNNGVRGLVFYTFMSLNGPCATNLSPYQEVASGSNNEKFNGDFGAGIPPVGSSAPEVTIDKSGTVTVLPGQRITYTIKATNPSADTKAGLPLVNLGLVVSDSIPANTTLAAGSIVTDSNTTILYSTDGGATWSETQPAPASSVTNIQVWQNNPLDTSASSTFTFSVQVTNSFPANTPPTIENCATTSFGQADPFARDCASTLVQGDYLGGHYVWRDENRNTLTDTGESYLPVVTLTLYYDANKNGIIDSDEAAISETRTTSSGYYTFTSLYTGTYIVAVDENSSGLPYGYRATTPITHVLVVSSTQADYTLANFGFGPSLSATKSLIGATYAGDFASYRIGVSNLRPGGGTTVGGECVVQTWSSDASTPNSPKNFVNPASIIGAPNGTFASADFKTGANKSIDALAFTKGTLPGAINRVEAAWNVYVQPGVTDDWLSILVYSGTTASQLGATDSTAMSAANLNKHIGPSNAGVITSLVTAPAGGWSWNIIGSLITQLSMQKSGGADGSIFYVDSAGLQIYFNGVCPAVDPSEVMTVVPLTDTYNANYLTFVSAVPAPAVVNTSTGVITWTNVGPLYPGQTSDVQVTFKVKYPVNPAASINNSMCVTGTVFLDNGPANGACGVATGVISPAGYITGVVWSDVAPTGWQGTQPSPGFTTTDYRIAGVEATLFRCEYINGSGIVPSPQTKACTDSSLKGQWITLTAQATDDSGYYQFTGLPDGFYIVQLTPGTLPVGFTQTADPSPAGNGNGTTCPTGTCDNAWGSDVALSNLTPIQNGNTITQVNFGYSGQAALYGAVWNDHNGDSTRQSGDGGLGVVTVTLRNITGTIVYTTTTNASGYYSFTGLLSGTYTITVVSTTLPAGGTWTQTYDPDSSCPSAGCDSKRTVTVNTGQISGPHDFGYRQSGTLSIGDLVYYDWDGNGRPTNPVGPSAEGIPSVTLLLYLDNGNSLFDSADGVVMTTTTSITGYYLFAGLPSSATPITYFVAVDPASLPARVTETADPDEAGICNVCNSRARVSLTTASTDTMDFGYMPHGTGAIGDTVWRDMNGDGAQRGPQETGIAGVLVTLTVDLNGDGNYVAVMTRTTDANGYYLFENLSTVLLPQGNYRVLVDSTSPNLPKDVYGFPYIPSTSISHTASITYAQTYLSADFGFVPLGAIGDTIYWDANGNAQQDWTEGGIGGITVTLVNSSGIIVGGVTHPAGTYQLTATTNATGAYLFTGLVSGTFTVTVGSITGNPALTGDPDTNGIPCPISSGPLAGYCDGKTSVKLNPGSIFLGADFGYQPTGVIGDFVFRDLNGNGQQDAGEPGISGVVVTVTNGTATITTTTDIDGRYSFSNLTATATYTVLFQTPANMISAADIIAAAASGNGSVGTSVTVTMGLTQVTAIGGVACTNCSLNIDSGFKLNGSFSVAGHVFFDASGNGGLYNPITDTAYMSIPVYLYNSDRLLIGSTTTDAHGAYTFTNLAGQAGSGITYTVSVDFASPKLTDLHQTAEPGVLGVPCVICHTYNTFTITTSSITDKDFGFYGLLDFGDLPNTYNTLLSAEGPRALITSTLHLGTNVTPEGDGKPSIEADGDGASDDGVQRNLSSSIEWTPGAIVPLTITVFNTTGNQAFVDAWFDWYGHGNGVFTTSVVAFGPFTGTGTQVVSVTIPTNYTYGYSVTARFRVYHGTPIGAQVTGLALSAPTGNMFAGTSTIGEVEDYLWTFSGTAIPMAVNLASFTATPAGDHNALAWETVSELRNLGFNLWRGASASAPDVKLNPYVIPSQAPGGTDGFAYSYDDFDITSGDTYYWLEDIDLNGTVTRHGPVQATEPGTSNSPSAVTLIALQAGSSTSALPFVAMGLALLVGAGVVVRRRRD